MISRKRRNRSSFLCSSIFRSVFLVSALLLFMIAPVVATATEYAYTEFSMPAGWSDVIPLDINDNGDVVLWNGMYAETGPGKAFIYSGGNYIPLLPPGWQSIHPWSINNKGVVSGWGVDGNGVTKGFMYSNGEYIEVIPPGWQEAYIDAINDNNTAVGLGLDPSYGWRSFIYSGGTYTTPHEPAGWGFIFYAINNKEQMAGLGIDDKQKSNAIIYNGTGFAQFLPAGWISAWFVGLNDNDTAIGWGYDADLKPQSIMYSSGTYTVLLPPGESYFSAWGINNDGAVVGGSASSSTGFVYSNGAYSKISPPDAAADAFSINNKGVVAGRSFHDSTTGAIAKWFIAVPVPNSKPIANAGANQTVAVGDIVTLNGSGSTDPNGDTLTYQWFFVSVPAGSSAAIASPASMTTTFVPDQPGIYTVQLIVNDGQVNSNPSIVQVTVLTKQEAAVKDTQDLQTAIASLDTSSLKGSNMQNALQNKLNAVLADIKAGNYASALDKLQNDILPKTDGCATIGAPDNNDWIKTCDAQKIIYPYVLDLIKLVKSMI